MNKNVNQAHGKLFYANVAPYAGAGEEKLILHEVTIENDATYSFGDKNVLVVDPSSVLML